MPSFDKHEEQHGLLTDVEQATDKQDKIPQTHCDRSHGHRLSSIILTWVSLAGNVFLLVLLLRPSHSADLIVEASRYAELRRNVEEPYVRITHYSSDNETLQDQLWHDIDIDPGVVALSDDWAAQHGLRTAQRFPWDQTKGVYLLHGYHNLHCLKIIHNSLSEYRRADGQSRSVGHINHCMDALRRQIMCDADDTPRATERRAEVYSGLLQHRKCRNWTELESFAKQHTACYKRPEFPEEGGIKLERFKHCPPESGYVVADDYVPTDEILVGLPSESMGDA